MRLDEKEQRIIREGAEQFFGADAVVRLFGSRVADDRRGGDIDLATWRMPANGKRELR